MAKSSKKRASKSKAKKPRTRKITYHSTKEIRVEKALTDNFIAIQRVMVNLSSKFETLSSQISKLLELFEISAKALARKDFDKEENKGMKDISDKLDEIAQKTGLIGRGITLMHEVKSPNLPREMPREIPEMRPRPQAPLQPPARPLTMPESRAMPKPSTMPEQTRPGFINKLGERSGQMQGQGYQRSIEEETHEDNEDQNV